LKETEVHIHTNMITESYLQMIS